ncbi:MAG: hypothetical protein II651_09160 [Selenomonas sp.]|nr:hypothetical protein [Selenomonas sp.]
MQQTACVAAHSVRHEVGPACSAGNTREGHKSAGRVGKQLRVVQTKNLPRGCRGRCETD